MKNRKDFKRNIQTKKTNVSMSFLGFWTRKKVKYDELKIHFIKTIHAGIVNKKFPRFITVCTHAPN